MNNPLAQCGPPSHLCSVVLKHAIMLLQYFWGFLSMALKMTDFPWKLSMALQSASVSGEEVMSFTAWKLDPF